MYLSLLVVALLCFMSFALGLLLGAFLGMTKREEMDE